MRHEIPAALAALLLTLTPACGGDGENGGNGNGNGGEEIAPRTVSGTVHDFLTGDPLPSATVSVSGISPAPTVSVSGSAYTIEDVPAFSVFHILAGSPPDYRSTYNMATEVQASDLSGVSVYAISESYLADLASAFGVGPIAGAVMLGQLVDESGQPAAGIPGTAFELADSIAGPFFLNAGRLPDPGLSESSASGYFVLFDVPSGLARVTADEESGYGMSMPDSPTAATAVTLARVVVTEGGVIEIPTDVSFSQDVVPIFTMRGCTNCHGGGGDGKNDGGLHLAIGQNPLYRELTEEISPNYGVTRVDLEEPEMSLLLTKPSPSDPPNHPTVVFAAPDDADKLLILGWIIEGALQN